LAVVIADDKAGGLFRDGPRRREVAGGHLIFRLSDKEAEYKCTRWENGGDGTRILPLTKRAPGQGPLVLKLQSCQSPTSLSLTRRSGSRAAGFFYRHQIFFGIDAVF
jgi:hypothetical protein